METVQNCHLCGSQKHTLLFEQVDLFHGCPGRFSVLRCQNCGLVFLSPRPTFDEMMDFYPDSYVAYTKPLTEETKATRIDRSYGLRKRFRFVKLFADSGRILDVGCATGVFLAEIHRLEPEGWALYGVEPGKGAASIARQTASAKIYTGVLEEANYPDCFFDVVTMWDVLEHVYQPVDTLKEVRRILKPGGVLIFSLPNLDSWDAAIFKHNWVGYDVPRHLHVFGDETLPLLLEQTRFIERKRACVAGSYFYFISSVVFHLRANHPRHWLTRFVWDNHAAMPPRLLTAPYFWLSDKMKKSTTLTIACQPK